MWIKCQTRYAAAGVITYINECSSSSKQRPSQSKTLLSRSVTEPSRAWDVARNLTILTTLTMLTTLTATQTRALCFYLITSPLITNKAALKCTSNSTIQERTTPQAKWLLAPSRTNCRRVCCHVLGSPLNIEYFDRGQKWRHPKLLHTHFVIIPCILL